MGNFILEFIMLLHDSSQVSFIFALIMLLHDSSQVSFIFALALLESGYLLLGKLKFYVKLFSSHSFGFQIKSSKVQIIMDDGLGMISSPSLSIVRGVPSLNFLLLSLDSTIV
jgi:hypothetical protein